MTMPPWMRRPAIPEILSLLPRGEGPAALPPAGEGPFLIPHSSLIIHQ